MRGRTAPAPNEVRLGGVVVGVLREAVGRLELVRLGVDRVELVRLEDVVRLEDEVRLEEVRLAVGREVDAELVRLAVGRGVAFGALLVAAFGAGRLTRLVSLAGAFDACLVLAFSGGGNAAA